MDSFVVLSHLFIHGCGYGTGLIFCLIPGVFSSGIRPRRIKWQWLESLFLKSCRCMISETRTRGRRACAASTWRKGAPASWLVLDEDGREAQLKPHMQPTAGGRTLVDADRIKAARIGDSLGVDLTERACRPLIRLSTHPTAAARAVRVS
ncbi:hypothetical protein EVAR_72202_1 [Eumeta japonica]|uniref:Uncharacterized protein n=1 Tax=Eumeta variegata TaxID=151549 RepID=A0A4C1SJY6_EUMVA|nr:hypothetical protein EVAR_72202_1 [Eumeta japonica]